MNPMYRCKRDAEIGLNRDHHLTTPPIVTASQHKGRECRSIKFNTVALRSDCRPAGEKPSWCTNLKQTTREYAVIKSSFVSAADVFLNDVPKWRYKMVSWET